MQLVSILIKYHGHERQGSVRNLQTGRDYRRIPKFSVGSWMGFWNTKRTVVENAI